MSDEQTPADILRRRYNNMKSAVDILVAYEETFIGDDFFDAESIVDDAFLDTAYEYALAAAEAQAWRERFERLQNAFKLKEVTLTTDELYERAKKFWPPEWVQR